jgi:hypothetical protein
VTSIANRDSSLTAGLYATFLIVLTGRDGRTVSVSSKTVRHHLKFERARLERSALRAIATRLSRVRDPRTMQAMTAASTLAAEAAADQLAVLWKALTRRELLLGHSRIGASRQLVQAGLFDGRALREAARQADRHRAFTEESEGRLDTLSGAPIVSVDVRLVSVLHVVSGRR